MGERSRCRRLGVRAAAVVAQAWLLLSAYDFAGRAAAPQPKVGWSPWRIRQKVSRARGRSGGFGSAAAAARKEAIDSYAELVATEIQKLDLEEQGIDGGNSSAISGTKKYIVKNSAARAVRQQQRTKQKSKPEQLKHGLSATDSGSHKSIVTEIISSTPNQVNFTIRPLELKEVSTCFHLGERVFSETKFSNLYRTWDESEVVSLINTHPEFCFIAEVVETDQSGNRRKVLGGFVLGSVLIKKHGKFCIGYLDWVVVEPRFQNNGIGTALIKEVIQVMKHDYQIKRLIADTPAENKPAINFFMTRIGMKEQVPHVYMSRRVTPSKPPEWSSGSSPPLNVTVRNLNVDDLHVVHSLGEVLFEKFPNLIRNWDEHSVMSQFQTDREFSIVAVINNTIAGFAMGTYIEKPLEKKKFGHLTWLGVDSRYSRRGIGRRLVIEFENLVRSEGCQQLLVDTEEDNIAAINLFNKLNFSHREKHVYFSKVVT